MSGISTAQYMEMLARLNRNPVRDSGKSVGVERESDLQDAILVECAQRGWLALASRMDRPTTVKVGVPDFIILADGGRTFAIETKARGGKLRTEQAAWLAWASKLGHKAAVCRSFAEFLDFVSTDPEKREQL